MTERISNFFDGFKKVAAATLAGLALGYVAENIDYDAVPSAGQSQSCQVECADQVQLSTSESAIVYGGIAAAISIGSILYTHRPRSQS